MPRRPALFLVLFLLAAALVFFVRMPRGNPSPQSRVNLPNGMPAGGMGGMPGFPDLPRGGPQGNNAQAMLIQTQLQFAPAQRRPEILAGMILAGSGSNASDQSQVQRDIAVAAVSYAFAKAGMPTISPSGVVWQAESPTLPVNLLDFEAQALVTNAGGSDGSATLVQLARALVAAGWQLPANRDPGQTLLAILAKAADPENPHSFTPLFLKATIQQRSAVDISSPEAKPEDIHLSMMEMQLLVSSFLRGEKSYPRPDSRQGSLMRFLAPGVAHAATPCDELLDQFGDFDVLVKLAGDKLGGMPMEALAEKLDPNMGPIKKTAFTSIFKVLKLATVRSSRMVQFTLSGQGDMRYNYPGEKPQEAVFVVTVTVPDWSSSDAWQISDCLNGLAGFNLPDSDEAVKEKMKDWQVKWWPGEGFGQHVFATGGWDAVASGGVSHLGEGGFQSHLGVSGSTGTAKLVIRTATQRHHPDENIDVPGHGLDADTVHGPVQVHEGTVRLRAELHDSGEAVDETTLVKALLGGWEEVLVDTLAGFYMDLTPLERELEMDVFWQEFCWENRQPGDDPQFLCTK